MKLMSHARRFAPVAALAALTVLVAACKTTAPLLPPLPPPPPPPPPPITLAPQLIQEASAWRGYMARAGSIAPQFADGGQIASSLRLAAAYEPRQFQRGALAYAAILALQDQTFVQGLRAQAADPAGRIALRDQIVANPNTVVNLPGAQGAADLIVAGVGADATRLLISGRAVKQAAYDVQRMSWSKKDVVNREGRLIEARTLSTSPMLGDASDVLMLSQAYNGAAPMTVIPQPAPAPWSPLVIRGMALGALAALGEAGDANSPQINSVTEEQSSGFCLKMAKLNMYQCLAVSKPHYEDVFCLGQHIMIDTGQCMIKASGAAMPPEPPPPPKPAPKVAATGKKSAARP
jgi:hypothetical protein